MTKQTQKKQQSAKPMWRSAGSRECVEQGPGKPLLRRAADKVVSAVQVVFRGDGRDAGGGHSRPGSGGGRVG
jgi:hypothetical protein